MIPVIYRPSLPWQRNLWNLAKNWLEFGLHKPMYELSLDFSLEFWLDFRRLWPAILRNVWITAIIQLVKLALLACFPGLY